MCVSSSCSATESWCDHKQAVVVQRTKGMPKLQKIYNQMTI
jgi:hypothetical protein